MRRKQQRQQQQPVRGVVGSGRAAPVKRACTAATLYALAADPVPGWAAHACVHARARPAPSLPQQHVTCDAPHTLAPCACSNHTPSPAPCRPLPPHLRTHGASARCWPARVGLSTLARLLWAAAPTPSTRLIGSRRGSPCEVELLLFSTSTPAPTVHPYSLADPAHA